MPKHPHPSQLRSTGERRGDPGVCAAVRPQDQRIGEALQANEAAFNRAVEEVTEATSKLLHELVTTAPPKNREIEAAKRRARAQQRYAA